MRADRGKVWLGVCGLVRREDDGSWLVVKKRYGGLLGKWSLPAGFVEPGETVDEATEREVLEETGIICRASGLIGARSGVLHGEISDNMLLFSCSPENTLIKVQEKELLDAQWLTAEELLEDEHTSLLIRELIQEGSLAEKPLINGLNPGNQFGYTAYKLFL